jgi:hypothetical protein
MEVLLALHGTASQARGFILLDVLHRFEEHEALDSACGVCTHMGVIAGHCAPRAIRLPLAYGKLCVAARASLRATRRAPRASLCAALRARHCVRVASRAGRVNARRALRASMHAARCA